jgi:prolipoprotein diacylglyceryltransferase
MQQVLFRIPIPIPGWAPDGIPIYGFAAMLFLALLSCTWLASVRAEQRGIARERIQDLAVWLFVGGIAGARLTFLYVEGVPLWQFFKLWEGGLVFYGSAVGGLIAYGFAYYFVIRRHQIATWELADVIAPSVALGLCLGRIGCFLNGCCYGAVACPDCPQVHFPLSSPPRFVLVSHGYQTAAGFTLSDQGPDDRSVSEVVPDSAAAASGLRPGDVIVGADGQPMRSFADLNDYLGERWPRGKNTLALTVRRSGEEIALPAFAPRTLGLQPTQLYESISMALVLFLLLAYEPFRRRPGEMMSLLMFCYGVQRALEELLRADPRPTGLEMYTSVFLMVVGPILWAWRRWGKGTVPGPAPATA